MEKPLLLPSNGLDYDKIVYVKPPDLEFLLFWADPFLPTSFTERIITLAKPYISVERPENLYLQDLYYIWLDMISGMINLERYGTSKICLSCREINSAQVDMTAVEIKYYGGTDKTKIYEHPEYDIEYRRRKAVDNIELNLQEINVRGTALEQNITWLLAQFIKEQIVSVYFEDELVEKADYFDFIMSRPSKEIMEIYNAIEEPDFGFSESIVYECASCETKNNSYLFENLQNAISAEPSIEMGELYDQYKTLIELAKLPTFDFSSALKVPLRHVDVMFDAIKDTEFHALF